MDKEKIITDLIEKWRNDSKQISKEAEKELVSIIMGTLRSIDGIRNMFGRSYDPHYPKITDKFISENCFYVAKLPEALIEISNIDNDYIYLYYVFGRKMTKEYIMVPLDIIINCSDKVDLELYKLAIIDAEKKSKEGKINQLKRSLEEAEREYKIFCEKYCQNN